MAEHVEDIEKPGMKEVVVTKKESLHTDYSDTQIDDYLAKFLDINENAKQNEQSEKAMSLKEGIKMFPKAAFWSMALSLAIVMEGYDTNLLNSFYAFPAFVKKYGTYYPELGEYQIPAKWQTSLSMAVNVGEILGLHACGHFADRYGYRKTLIGGMIMVIGFIFIVFFSPNVQTVLAGELLLGIPWGMFQTLTVSYASEVCPMVLRLYLTTFVNACWVLGQLISSGILRGALTLNTADSYKIPWGIQWVWPPIIIVLLYFAPESPWWLVKKGKMEEAKHSLTRLLSKTSQMPDTDPLAEAMLNKIQLTIKEEEELTKNATYRECFSGTNLRRTRIASLVWVFQNITGSALMGYSTYFYIQAGLDEGMSFTFSIIQYSLGLLGTLASWILSQKFGRFQIYFGGLVINFFILMTVGGLDFANSDGASWAIGSLLLIFTFVYDATVGPMTYCVVAELPTSKLRTKTVILARNFYNLAGIPVAVLTPYMLNPSRWNWKAKTGFFWAGFALMAIIWSWFEMPETKGRTYAELDILFKDKVKARKFSKTEVETFNTQELIDKIGDEGIRELVDANAESKIKSKSEDA